MLTKIETRKERRKEKGRTDREVKNIYSLTEKEISYHIKSN